MILLLLALVGLAFLAQQRICRKYWNKDLTARVTFEDTYAYEGDTSCLTEEISNGKWLPVPALEVRLAMDRALKFSGEAKENSNVTDQTYRRDIFSLSSNQRIIRRLTFHCEKRGYFQIKKAELAGNDFLFTERYHMDQPENTGLYVYPRPVDVRRIQLAHKAVSGMLLVQNRLYPDPFEFAGIREYRPTDPMSHINWKASARNGELLVNQHDSTTSVQVRMILDVQDNGILKYERLTEEGIRIAASLASRLVRQNMELDIISNGVCRLPEDASLLSMHLKPGAGQVQELLRRLACLDTSERIENINIVIKEQSRPGGNVQVFISHSQDEQVIQAVRGLAEAGCQVLWIFPLSPVLEVTVPPLRGVDFMRWEVE